ncbi:hypothetical protein GCM10023185_38050 [Hymenobacter saemangeumensis]|uniref:Fibronectin type-III domain-containing protein n=1 Tax=Hymenobacter saemangeumensis TaxID=1084522 RepID=A0ABP8IRW6_9BACT
MVPASGSVVVTTSAVAGSSLTDTVLGLYSGTCAALTQIGCNDDANGLYSSVTVAGLPAGSTIYARVFSYDATPTGQFGICAVGGSAAPANDNPSGAIALTMGSTCTPTNGTNAGATTTTPSGYTNPGGCGIAVSPRDVFYTFTTAASGAGSTAATVTVTGNPAGLVRVFQSAGGAAGPFTEVSCSAGTTNNTVASPLGLTNLTPNTTYYISVSGYGSNDTQGAFTICVTNSATPTCGNPTALSVSNVTNTSATFSFTAGANNTSYIVTLTPQGGMATTISPNPTSSPVQLTGLTPNTQYTLTIQSQCANGGMGTALSGTFTTQAGAAPVNDNPSGAVTLAISSTCTPTSGTNAGATTTTANGYTNPGTGCGIAINPKDVWYRFTTAASGLGSTAVTITVTGAPAGYLRLFSSTGGASGPFTEVACASGGNNNTVSAPLSVNTLMPNTTYYVSVAGYGSNDTQGAFTICVTSTPNNDLAVQSIQTLGTVSSYASPVGVQVVIRNAGVAATTARNVTLTVSGATTYTSTQPVPAIAVGATAIVTFPAFPITASTGTNTITVTLPADDAPANNTATTQQAVSSNMLSYTTPGTTTFAGGFGSNTAANATVYVRYTTNTTPTTVTAVTPTFAGTATASNNYEVVITDASGANGAPGMVLYTSPARVRPLAGGADVVPIPNIAVSGSFYVGVRQLTTTNFGLAYENESPLRTGTFLFSTNGMTFTDLSTAGTTFRPAVAVTLRNPLATRNDALAATVGLYPNPAHRAFTLAVPAGKLHNASATLYNGLGQVVQQRQLNLPVAGGEATFDVAGLAAGVYTLQLKTGAELVVKRVVVE